MGASSRGHVFSEEAGFSPVRVVPSAAPRSASAIPTFSYGYIIFHVWNGGSPCGNEREGAEIPRCVSAGWYQVFRCASCQCSSTQRIPCPCSAVPSYPKHASGIYYHTQRDIRCEAAFRKTCTVAVTCTRTCGSYRVRAEHGSQCARCRYRQESAWKG